MLTKHNHFYSMYPLITKIQKDVISGEISADLAQKREHTEKLLTQATFILRHSLMRREISHLLTRFCLLWDNRLRKPSKTSFYYQRKFGSWQSSKLEPLDKTECQ